METQHAAENQLHESASLNGKTIGKDQLLDVLEQTVELHLQELVRVYQNLPVSIMLKPAAEGGWSIAQCFDHLNSYGHYYLPRIKSGLTASKHPSAPVFTSTWLGKYFTRTMDPRTGKKKYKAFRDHIPSENLDPYAVIAEFIRQEETLLACLRLARTSDLNKIRIPVSISKWVRLRLGDVLQFLIAHHERHFLQAKRVLSRES